MSSQKSSLQAVLDRQAASAPPTPAPSRRRAKGTASVEPSLTPQNRPSREGKRLVAGHFDARIAKQLRILAAEEDTTIQALLEEAIDLLFVKKGRGAVIRS